MFVLGRWGEPTIAGGKKHIIWHISIPRNIALKMTPNIFWKKVVHKRTRGEYGIVPKHRDCMAHCLNLWECTGPIRANMLECETKKCSDCGCLGEACRNYRDSDKEILQTCCARSIRAFFGSSSDICLRQCMTCLVLFSISLSLSIFHIFAKPRCGMVQRYDVRRWWNPRNWLRSVVFMLWCKLWGKGNCKGTYIWLEWLLFRWFLLTMWGVCYWYRILSVETTLSVFLRVDFNW